MAFLSLQSALFALVPALLYLFQYLHKNTKNATLNRIPKAHSTSGVFPFWILWQRFQNTENVAVNEAHERHGPIVRIGPQELSVNLVHGGIRTIYGSFEKHSWYHSFYNLGGPNMFTFEDSQAHGSRRRALSRIYSKTSLLSSPVVRAEGEAILRERLLPILANHARSGEPLEAFETMLSATMDVVTAFLFGLKNSAEFLSNSQQRESRLHEYNSRRPYAFYAQELQGLWTGLEQVGINPVPKNVRDNTTRFEAWVMNMCDLAEKNILEKTLSGQGTTSSGTVYEQLRNSIQKFPQALSSTQRLQIGSELADHMIAGHETSGVALTYLIFELSKNNSRQTTLRNEIRTLLKESNQELGSICDFGALDALPFLHALVMEILRLYPPIAGAQARVTPGNSLTSLGEYKEIPGGVRVSARAYCLHRNPEVYPQPDVFKPERWLDSQGKFLKPSEAPEIHQWWWAFGGGGRMCLGNNFALHERHKLQSSNHGLFGDPTALSQVPILKHFYSGHDLFGRLHGCAGPSVFPAREFRYPRGPNAYLLAVFGGATLISSPFAGWLADNVSSRRIPFLLGLALQAASTALFAVSPRVEVLLVARAFQGLSAAVVYSVGLAILVDTVGVEQIGQQAGYFLSSANFGVLISPMLGGCVYQRSGYYSVVFMMIGLVVVDIILRLLMIEKKDALKWLPADDIEQPILRRESGYGTISGIQEPTSTLVPGAVSSVDGHPSPPTKIARKIPPFLRLLINPRALSSFLAVFVGFVILAGFDAGLAVFVKEYFHWSSTYAGLIFLGIALPSLLSPIAGHLSDVFGPRWIVVGGFVASAAGLFGIGFVSQPQAWQVVALIVLLVIIGTGLAFVFPCLADDLTNVAEEMGAKYPEINGATGPYAQAFALFNCGIAAGTVLGPLWIGLAVPAWGWLPSTFILGIFALLACVPVYLFLGPEKTSEEGSTDVRTCGQICQ
ncbi:hypothetical protein G7Y89_g4693 [Cudoniella acicularis]|uniref:Major facilitator superfamily (MFS) profile domain-containing protein n=1 Tax=Cudoniella acicularis TaxID=354080 RepID=A0A8H4RQD7_9HELO|nr:hypothetical protein G7Y89_g4693 [Cudoniella acicularis]